jgi:putative transposase
MPRYARQAPGGIVYHVLNRAVARLPLFEKPGDYDAFERVLMLAHEKFPLHIFAYALMPNHWHFVLQPRHDGELTDFCRWLTHTHTMRWHAHYHTSGTGHLYQGRFKAFPVEADDHFYTVCRYVERNPLRADLVRRADHWRWTSLWRRLHADQQTRPLLSEWPLAMPENWLALVQEPQTDAELAAIRRSVVRNCPFGSAVWQQRTAKRLALEHTLRARGRPKKKEHA